ncbi:MAG: imidazole glycerol phosphate synthase subunit HisH, partial [Candidatus Omnitrophica bacterium]|nr:imidazole glycerol phosphate synthase subunit HisH [Candidatus Omnitrophota bacterium]
MDNHFVSIVDYDLGNLFSVEQACRKVGLTAVITSSADKIQKSQAVILTGVGAFAKAMEILTDKGL